MKTMNAHIARNVFNEKIVDLVNDYLDNRNDYPEDTCIAVQKLTGEMKLLPATESDPGWEVYPISSFLHQIEYNGMMEVDIVATLDLADKYYFIK